MYTEHKKDARFATNVKGESQTDSNKDNKEKYSKEKEALKTIRIDAIATTPSYTSTLTSVGLDNSGFEPDVEQNVH